MPSIRTVLGDISIASLGVCLSHEHLLGRPPREFANEDQTLDSREAALAELARFRSAGGQSIIEMTTPDYGQDVVGLRRLAEASGVHIVAAAGYNQEKYSAQFLDASIDKMAERFTRSIQAGIGETGVRAGLLKASSTQDEISPKAEKMFRAVARAHRATGAPISTHAEGGTMALQQIELLTSEGVAPGRIVIGHLDRKLDWDYLCEVAARGVFLGFDQIGKEHLAPDSRRVEFITRLIAAGYGKQIVLSGDQSRRSYWPSYGHPEAPGLTHLLEKFIPQLRQAGVTTAQIDDLLVQNPSQAFALYK